MGRRASVNASCAADYLNDCPDGWVSTSAKHCKAPPAYSGLCGYFVEAAKYTAAQKKAYAEACDAPWPCATSSVGFLAAANAATAPHPILNVHVVEPKDAIEKQLIADEHRSKRHELFEVEERELFERDFLANMMASVTAKISELEKIAESV